LDRMVTRVLGDEFTSVLARAKRGDEQAFSALWRDANPMLLRYLRVTAGAMAEDVASYAWIRVIESLSGFEGDEPGFRRWLVTIARNQFLDICRRAARRPERFVPDLVAAVDRTGEVTMDAASAAEELMSTDWALSVIATLPPAQAELVMLRVVIGLDVASVAAVTGRSPGAVRVAVHRSLRTLRETVQAQASRPVTPDVAASFH
jgi:RNA polymerase sigma-70 factor (ECF subfamily)